MYIHKLYPTKTWYKNLASILAASGSLTKLVFLQNLRLRESSPNQNWRQHGARGPGPATYNIRRVFDDPGAQQPKQRSALAAGRLESHRFCPWGKKPPMVRKKPTCKEPPKVEPQNPSGNDCNGRDILACNGLLAKSATGLVFSGTLKVQGTPGALKPGVRDHESLVGWCQLVSY